MLITLAVSVWEPMNSSCVSRSNFILTDLTNEFDCDVSQSGTFDEVSGNSGPVFFPTEHRCHGLLLLRRIPKYIDCSFIQTRALSGTAGSLRPERHASSHIMKTPMHLQSLFQKRNCLPHFLRYTQFRSRTVCFWRCSFPLALFFYKALVIDGGNLLKVRPPERNCPINQCVIQLLEAKILHLVDVYSRVDMTLGSCSSQQVKHIHRKTY